MSEGVAPGYCKNFAKTDPVTF